MNEEFKYVLLIFSLIQLACLLRLTRSSFYSVLHSLCGLACFFFFGLFVLTLMDLVSIMVCTYSSLVNNFLFL